MKKLFIGILFALAISPVRADAQTVLQMDLFYDSRVNFRIDKFVEEPIQILENSETNTVSEKEGDYYAMFISSNGQNIDENQYYFTPDEDVFQLKLPYVPEATGVRFFRSGRTTLLSQIDIQEYSKCNQNGICAYEEGETMNLCPQDCRKENTTFSESTQTLLNENGGEILSEDGVILIKQNPLEEEAQPIEINVTESRKKRNQALVVLGVIVFIGLTSGGVIYKLYKK